MYTENLNKWQEKTWRGTNNKIMADVEEQLQRWKEYIEALFGDDRDNKPRTTMEKEEIRPKI